MNRPILEVSSAVGLLKLHLFEYLNPDSWSLLSIMSCVVIISKRKPFLDKSLICFLKDLKFYTKGLLRTTSVSRTRSHKCRPPVGSPHVFCPETFSSVFPFSFDSSGFRTESPSRRPISTLQNEKESLVSGRPPIGRQTLRYTRGVSLLADSEHEKFCFV